MAFLLVADNSPFYRQLLVDALGEGGHRVRAVGDGLEALEALSQEPPDAIVLDLVMPHLDGARACRQIKSNPATRSIPVVILSGLREDEIDQPDSTGADAYVAKMQASEMVANLLVTLEELLAGTLRDARRGFAAMHRREVVSELLQARRSSNAILSSLTEGYLRLAENGRVIEANPAALQMLDRTEGEIVNQSAATVLGCGEERIQDLLCPETGGRARLVSAERVLEARATKRIQSGTHQEQFILLSDVTEEESARRERRELQERMQAAKRSAELGEIVSGVAHELNNPLTAVIGYADLLLQLASDERLCTRLQKLQHEALRCRRVVENLLCFAGKRQAYPRSHDLNSVVKNVLAQQSLAGAKTNAKIVLELDRDLPHGRFDRAQIEQVITNLVGNSLQALAGQPEGQRRITVRTSAGPGNVRVEVEDSGPGVPVENRERIFEPFFTTHRLEGGTGLGLAICRGIVQENGGRIGLVDSAMGTTMRIDLPQAEAAGGRKGLREGEGVRGKTPPSVLLVDDEPVILDLIEDVLSDSGFHVRRAGNGAQALEQIRETGFDAMLIDLKMPDMDGRRLYEVVCERRPDMASRVIFTTGDLDASSVTRFLADSGNVLLRKPFHLEEVAATFQAVVDQTRAEEERLNTVPQDRS
ncbi:MAG: response regulator [Acidobacteriota bacterium]